MACEPSERKGKGNSGGFSQLYSIYCMPKNKLMLLSQCNGLPDLRIYLVQGAFCVAVK